MRPEAKIQIYTQPTDLRKGAKGLISIVHNQIKCSLWDGDLFVFFNQHCSLVKILFWDGTGFIVCSKRLIKGRFVNIFQEVENNIIRLSREQMKVLLSGSKLRKILSAQK